ncbi:MAG TPA: glutathione S-transferase N-terminal domain-containing protein [Gammaproteobacteria bacterium]|nr:glutathione S-transferase N-terminal domain-containing protein [Gammaproteobacteria bacterium]
MPRKLFELVGRDDNRFSPYCWRTLMALTHKRLDFERVPCRFTDKERIAFSGQGRVPVLSDGAHTVHDSWTIAEYLEDSFPDRPPLFPGGTPSRALARFVNAWADTAINPVILRLVILDLFRHVDPADQDYFRRTREERLGDTLENLHATRDRHIPAFRAALRPLETLLKSQAFVSGEAPAYADFIVFGTFQWARLTSPLDLTAETPAIRTWRERMLDLFDGLGRRARPAQ